MKKDFGMEHFRRKTMELKTHPAIPSRVKKVDFILIPFFFTILWMFGALPMAIGADQPFSLVIPDAQCLAGRWIRPDGGYVLEFREVDDDGTLQAAYYNPRAIKVFRANWTRNGAVLGVVVELRDVNYPGSTYSLQYDQKNDTLRGAYFQAVQKETYLVEFMRKK